MVCSAIDECHLPGECTGKNQCSTPLAPNGQSCGADGICTDGVCGARHSPQIVTENYNLLFKVDGRGDVLLTRSDSTADAISLHKAIENIDAVGQAVSAATSTAAADTALARSQLGTKINMVSTLTTAISTQAGALSASVSAHNDRLTQLEGVKESLLQDVEDNTLEINRLETARGNMQHTMDDLTSLVANAVTLEEHGIHINLTKVSRRESN